MNVAVSAATASVAISMMQRRKRAIIAIINKKRNKEYMADLLNTFIGKTCSFATIDGNYAFEKFLVKEVIGNAVLVEKKDGTQIILNTDFIIGCKVERPWK